jgi:methylmalonyl-CoA carboxyltransferase 12S subunit
MNDVAYEKLEATVAELKSKLDTLTDRLSRLEVPAQTNGHDTRNKPVTPAPAPVIDEGISPDVVLAISAAVAAYLGERPHIRAIRLIGSSRWAQQGRVSIQASRNLGRR